MIGQRLKYLVLAAALSAGGCAMPAGATDRAAVPAQFAALDADLTTRCAEGTFSGIVLVRMAGADVYERACSPDRTPNRSELYKIFSASKTFTGTAILSLAEAGRLDLDAPISRYLPAAPAGWSSVTLDHLLHHNSGISDHSNALLNRFLEHGAATHHEAMEGVLAELAGEPQVTPGGDFRYNNFGYELLAHIAATSEAQPFDQLLRERIFAPAAMADTVADTPVVAPGEAPRSIAAPGLVQGYNGGPGELEEALSYSFVQLGAGAIFSSADDLARFADAMNEGRIVSDAMMERSADDALILREGLAYGAGFFVRNANGCTMYEHSGGTNGFTSDLARFPELDASIVILSNYGFTPVGAIRNLAADAPTANADCGSEGS